MKKNIILSLLVFGLAGCETYNRAPYSATMGDYGFTYDMDNSPSPFVDTGYRPLTPYDLAAPIIVVVTNQPPARIVYKEAPPIGETVYSGETPARPVVATGSPTIVESAGAQPGQGAAAGAAAPASGAPPALYGSGGDALFFPGNVVPTNTNVVITNITGTNGITNTNVIGFITNTNVPGITNTNALPGTNGAINEPAGTELQTNRGIDEPPGTQLETNRGIDEPAGTQLQTNRGLGEPPVPPPANTNRVLFVPVPRAQPQAQPPVQTPVQQPPAFRTPPPQRPPAQTAPVQAPPAQTPRQAPSGPPASAPQSPPAPAPAPPPAANP